MPQIGEIRRAREIWPNKIWKNRSTLNQKSIWTECPICGKQRWVHLSKGNPRSLLCQKCFANTPQERQRRAIATLGANSPLWKGGRQKDIQGYIRIRLLPDNFFYPMCTKQHQIFEHRLIMAKHLKRCLLPWEVVHHKNGIKDDNKLENLKLLPGHHYHVVDSIMKAHMKNLEQKITDQTKEIKLLQWQIMELTKQLQLWQGREKWLEKE